MERSRIIAIALLVGVVLVAAAPPAHAAKRITEYTLPTGGSLPEGITAGPDGNL